MVKSGQLKTLRIKDNRTSRYEKGLRTKTRYATIGFVVGFFNIEYRGKIYENVKGYSGRTNLASDTLEDQAVVDAKYNAIVQVAIENKDVFNETDDIKNIDESVVEGAVMVDKYYYYPDFLDSKILEDKNGVIRFRGSKGRFVKVDKVDVKESLNEQFERLEAGLDSVRKNKSELEKPLTLEEEKNILNPNKVRARAIKLEFAERVLNGEDPAKVKKELIFRERFR